MAALSPVVHPLPSVVNGGQSHLLESRGVGLQMIGDEMARSTLNRCGRWGFCKKLSVDRPYVGEDTGGDVLRGLAEDEKSVQRRPPGF